MVALRPEYAEKLRNPKVMSNRRMVVAVISELAVGFFCSVLALGFTYMPLQMIFRLLEPLVGIVPDDYTPPSDNALINVARWLVVFTPQLIPLLLYAVVAPFAVSLAGRFWSLPGSLPKTLRASLMVAIPLNLLLWFGALQSIRLAYSGEEIIPALEIIGAALLIATTLPATIVSTIAYTRSVTPPAPAPEEAL